jgi:hypothetical protein
MRKLVWSLALVALLLAGCGQVGRSDTAGKVQSQGMVLSDLRGLTMPQLYVPDPNDWVNCAINEFSMPGQGYYMSDAVGGLSYQAVTASSSAGKVGAGLQGSFFSGATLNRSMVVLIADDFKNGIYEVGNALFTQTTLDQPTIQYLEQIGALSHGALVARHARDVLVGTGRFSLVSYSSGEWRYKEASTSSRLTVKAINTGLSNSAVIADKIKSYLQFLALKNQTAVVNLSFALMPCSVKTDFEQWNAQNSGVQTLEGYMQALATLNSANYDELVAAIVESTNLSNDPLLGLINDPTYGATRHVYVAASGNFSLKYSMYPANWKNVVNVTGSTASSGPDGRVRSDKFFNQGEIMHTAASLVLNPPLLLPNSKKVYYLGTSFSAPTVSVFSALDLAGWLKCGGGNGISKLATNSLGLLDRHLEDWVVNNQLQQKGAVNELCTAQ